VTLESSDGKDTPSSRKLRQSALKLTSKSGEQVSAEPIDEPNGSDGPSSATVAGVVVGIIFAVAVVAVAVVVIHRRRRPSQVYNEMAAHGRGPDGSFPPQHQMIDMKTMNDIEL